MRILFAQFEASLKYHGHANWTQWISPETGKRSALYLGTNIGRGHYTLHITHYTLQALAICYRKGSTGSSIITHRARKSQGRFILKN